VDIRTRTWRALEWDRLKEFLSAEALTVWGKERCQELEPHCEPALVQVLLEETSEGLSLIEARSPLSQEGLPDLRETLKRLSAGADLATAELLEIRAAVQLSRLARSSLALLDASAFPRLTSFLPSLHSLQRLVEAIDLAIDENGQVRDSATPHLKGLRREIQNIDSQIKEELLRIIHSASLSKALQELLYTQRGGRYVVPVQASMRHLIQGIVHDSSASGLTVYVEPIVVVELANKVRLKEAEVEREIARILSELSGQARSSLAELDSTFQALVELDFIMARARLGLKYDGACPALSAEGKLQLRQARHPLLVLQDLPQASQVVPNDIILGGAERTMVVTGPNTGGKTVLLKTAGLMSLMVRAGLLLPVQPGSTAAIFSEIFADIGDEQSLVQSLSTFSSHMTNIVEVVNRAGPGSLVLLDEIGAGTDPREGAALARAVLEHLNDSGALTISTTHFGELKTLAYSHAGFINASLDFDEESLSPTYRLRLGVPGSSKATTIAGRLGLNAQVVARAESFVLSGSEDLQRTIDQLETKLRDLARQEEVARDAMLRAGQLEEAAREQLARLDSEGERLRQEQAAQMESEFKRARAVLRELISSLQKQPSSQRAQQVQKQMEAIKQELKWLQPEKEAKVAQTLTVGQTVRVLSLNQNAVVEALPENRSREPDALVSVRAGSLRLRVPVSDLKVLEQPQPEPGQRSNKGKAAKAAGTRKQESTRRSTAGLEQSPVFVRTDANTLDLRGQRVEEAIAQLERFLDEALLSGINPTMIIHGHGTGAIKSAVRDYLSSSSYARSFRPGEVYEGGDGVTVVELP